MPEQPAGKNEDSFVTGIKWGLGLFFAFSLMMAVGVGVCVVLGLGGCAGCAAVTGSAVHQVAQEAQAQSEIVEAKEAKASAEKKDADLAAKHIRAATAAGVIKRVDVGKMWIDPACWKAMSAEKRAVLLRAGTLCGYAEALDATTDKPLAATPEK